MNDFADIECELRKLQPAPVRPELVARVEKAFLEESASVPTSGLLPRGRSTRNNWISLGLGVGLAAAAGFLILARVNEDQGTKKTGNAIAVTPTPNESRPVISGRMVPAGLTEVVYHTRDEGLHFPEGATQPVRRMRYHTRETLHWQNPQTGASLLVSYLSEEVVLLPVPGQ